MSLIKISKYLARIVILAVIYHLLARLALQMAYVQANTSPVWPPSGIALAALLLMGIRYWPGITLGVVVGSLVTGAPLSIALGLGLANTLEALVGAYLFQQRLHLHISIDRIRDVVGLAIAAAVSTAVSATIGVAALFGARFAEQGQLITLWATWWVGNLLGVLVIAPFILIWVKQFPKHFNQKMFIESSLYLILLLFVMRFVFENPVGTGIFHQALIYLIFPFAIWAALRLEQRGAVTTIFAISILSIWNTVHGKGPFSQLAINDSLILLQTFTGVVCLTTLTLAASASERRNAEQSMNRRVQDLVSLNDASKEFLANLEQTTLFESICRFIVSRMNLSAAWIELTTGDNRSIGYEPPVTTAYIDSSIKFDLQTQVIQMPIVRKSIRQVEENNRSLVLEQFEQTGNQSLQNEKSSYSFAAFPLGSGGKAGGVLCVIIFGQTGFPKEEVLLLESYANLAAIAIQNAWLFDQVRMGNEQLHALSHRLMEIQEEERMHLSRELHDESGQILAALMVRLGLLERDVEIPFERQEHINELRRIVTEILNNLHNLAIKLRPASLDHLGLITALKQYADDYSRQYQIEVQFDALDLGYSRLPAEIETALFRIMQESLTNVAMHAQASRVDILLNRRNSCLVMTIEDNGIGFNPDVLANENRLGLFGMRERVEMLGGHLVIESSPGRGTTISVEVPYDDSSSHSR